MFVCAGPIQGLVLMLPREAQGEDEMAWQLLCQG